MWRLSRPSRIMTCDETVLLIREAEVAYQDGIPVPMGAPVQFELRCNVQPSNTGDLMLLPEGERLVEQFHLYVPEGQDVVPQENDFVMRKGGLFQVQDVRDWESYQKARITRVDTGAKSAIDLAIVASP